MALPGAARPMTACPRSPSLSPAPSGMARASLASGIERIVRRSRSDVRPEQFEHRARLVSAIARGRRWLDDGGPHIPREPAWRDRGFQALWQCRYWRGRDGLVVVFQEVVHLV